MNLKAKDKVNKASLNELGKQNELQNKVNKASLNELGKHS